jgi:hypothetical protein
LAQVSGFRKEQINLSCVDLEEYSTIFVL